MKFCIQEAIELFVFVVVVVNFLFISDVCGVKNETIASAQGLIRGKRQTFNICPNEPASGSDNGRSFILFYSQETRKDVRLSYIQNKWTSKELKKLQTFGFNVSQPSIIYVHAWQQHSKADWLINVRRQYDELFPKSSSSSESGPTFNLLFFDWGNYASQMYSNSASWVPHLGKVLSEFLNQINKHYSYPADRVHLISFSLGTHVAGQTGRRLGKTNRLARITALDPTGVCFHENSQFASQYALQPSDAKLVVARHYDMNSLGAKRSIGGVDIFVNGGRNQPSNTARRSKRQTRSYVSDHSRAAEQESGQLKRDETCYEVAYACRSYEAFSAGECGQCGSRGNKCYYIDNLNAKSHQMIDKLEDPVEIGYKAGTKMYIRTGVGPEFCLHHYQVLVNLKPSASANAKRLVASASVVLDFGSGVRANPWHKIADQPQAEYSSLLVRRKRIELPSEIKVKAKKATKTQNNDTNRTNIVGRFTKSLDYVELNYMSNPIKSERVENSARYCPSSARNSLVRC